ncbi:hypothetical protein Tco_0111010 [Tanacetum coccineum]
MSLSEQMISICDMVGQYIQKKEEEKLIAEEQAAKTRYWKILICYDDDNDEEYYEAFYFDDDHIEEKSSGSTTTHSDISLSKYDSFIFDLSNDPFPPADRSDFYHEEFADELAHIISPLEYDCFYFKSEPNPGELTSIVDSGIRENVPSSKNVNLPFEDDQSPLLAYVVWIFLFFHVPLLLINLVRGNEDTVFDPRHLRLSFFYAECI